MLPDIFIEVHTASLSTSYALIAISFVDAKTTVGISIAFMKKHSKQRYNNIFGVNDDMLKQLPGERLSATIFGQAAGWNRF